MTLLPVAWADYFGRESYGAIRGVALSLQVLAQAAGPLLSGALRDWSGNYTLSLMVFGVLAALAACAAARVAAARLRCRQLSRKLFAARKRLRPPDKEKTAAARSRKQASHQRRNQPAMGLRRDLGIAVGKCSLRPTNRATEKTACRHCWR